MEKSNTTVGLLEDLVEYKKYLSDENLITLQILFSKIERGTALTAAEKRSIKTMWGTLGL